MFSVIKRANCESYRFHVMPCHLLVESVLDLTSVIWVDIELFILQLHINLYRTLIKLISHK